MATDINNMKLLQENCNVKLEVTAVGDSVVSEQFNLMGLYGYYFRRRFPLFQGL